MTHRIVMRTMELGISDNCSLLSLRTLVDLEMLSRSERMVEIFRQICQK